MRVLRKAQVLLTSREFILGAVAVIIGSLYRGLMAGNLFLQADEEIFSYDAYYFILGRSFEFITGKIGAYIGYPFTLSLWFRLFGVSLVSARAFSVVCSAVMLLFVLLTLKKITGSIKPAFLGTLALALLPFPLRYGHVVLSEPLVWAIITPGIYLLVKGIIDKKWYHIFLSGVLFSSAFFVRRSALILLFMLVPALIWTNRDSLKGILKEAGSMLGGFLLPFVLGIGGFIFYFGWDKLVDLRFTRIPNISTTGDINFSGHSSFENALYTLQPTSWVGAGPMILLLAGSAVLFVSLFKDRWKAVYVGAFLWPALVRVMLDGQMDSLPMARIMVIPIIALFLNRTYKADHGFYLALSILFGSSVAFSYVYLSGDIWNVIIYCSAGAMILVYLADRLESRLLTLLPLIGGMISLYFIAFKEPQIERLVLFLLPVAGLTYSLSLSVLKKPTRQIPIVLIGITLPLIFLGSISNLFDYISAGVIFAYALALLLIGENSTRWFYLRLLAPVVSICFTLMTHSSMPTWGIYLPLLGIVIFMLSGYIRSSLVSRFTHLIPVTGGIMAFFLCYISSRDLVISGISGIYISTASIVISNLEPLSNIWRHKVREKISVILLMITIGYLAFYVFLRWTHIYMMEFLVQSALIGGLLIWVMRDTHMLSRTIKSRSGYRRFLRPVRIRRRSSAVLIAIIILSVPFSVGSFLQDDWFKEERMDKRPYMRTIIEIAGWIEDNSDEGDKVLVWHCYAVEAERETIIEPSNAAIYNGKQVMVEMEEQNVNIFVRDWYVDHGLWEGQPYFRDYILENFIIDKVIDGNECWIRSSRVS